MDKKFRLPKDEFIDGQDVEGHRRPPADGATPRGESFDPLQATPRGDSDRPRGESLEDEDVEGHRVTRTDGNVEVDDFTILPAPPSIGLRRTPGHGGE